MLGLCLILATVNVVTISPALTTYESRPIRLRVEWTWQSGSKRGNQPSIEDGRFPHPGAREGAATWTDPEGILWLFGGLGYSSTPSNEPQLLNDLWKYNLHLNEWTVVPQNDTREHQIPGPRESAVACGFSGLYFMLYGGMEAGGSILADTWVYNIPKGIWLPVLCDASHINNCSHILAPPNRTESASWCMPERLVISGGVNRSLNVLDDMWSFSLKELLWFPLEPVSGPRPAPRNGASTWYSTEGSYYMFGGNTMNGIQIQGNPSNAGYASDVWRLHNDTWGFMNGVQNRELSQKVAQNCRGVYGTKGTPSVRERPGCRKLAASWTNIDGNLLLYGGVGTTDEVPYFYTHGQALADLWMYDFELKQWLWVGGTKQPNALPSYSTADRRSTSNSPGARYNAACFVYNDTYFLFGGYGFDTKGKSVLLNDLWSFKALAITYLIEEKPITDPITVFLLTVSTMFVIFGLFGTVLFVKKSMNGPKHPPRGHSAVQVHYSRIENNVDFHD